MKQMLAILALLLAVIFFIFRCGTEGQNTKAEVLNDTVKEVSTTHTQTDKTLFPKQASTQEVIAATTEQIQNVHTEGVKDVVETITTPTQQVLPTQIPHTSAPENVHEPVKSVVMPVKETPTTHKAAVKIPDLSPAAQSEHEAYHQALREKAAREGTTPDSHIHNSHIHPNAYVGSPTSQNIWKEREAQRLQRDKEREARRIEIDAQRAKIEAQRKLQREETQARKTKDATLAATAASAAALLVTQKAEARDKERAYILQQREANRKARDERRKQEQEQQALERTERDKAQALSREKIEQERAQREAERKAAQVAQEEKAQAQRDAKYKAAQIARAKLEAEKEADEKAKLEAEKKAQEEAQRLADEKAKDEKLKLQKEAEEKAKLEAEKKAQAETQRLADEKAKAEKLKLQKEAEEKAKLEAENKAQAEAQRLADEKAKAEKLKLQKEAEEKAKLEAEKKAQEEIAKKEAEEKRLQLQKEAEVAAALLLQKQAKAKEEAERTKLESSKKTLFDAFALTKVEFKHNKAELTEKSKEILNETASLMQAHPSFHYNIQGHTDSTGKEAYNLSLSEQRAKSVMYYLTLQGVDAKLLSSKGYGSSQPIADNSSREGRLQNRRVVFEIIQ